MVDMLTANPLASSDTVIHDVRLNHIRIERSRVVRGLEIGLTMLINAPEVLDIIGRSTANRE